MLGISSCKSQSNHFNNLTDEYLKSLSTRNGYYVDVIIPFSKDKFMIVNTTLLLYSYEQNYKFYFSDEFSFLRALYDGKINDIDKHYRKRTKFHIDKSILADYTNKGLDYIIAKYLTKNKDGDYSFKDFIDYTVVSIMFRNNYYLYFDDYSPNYHFTKKLEDLAIPDEW